MFPVYENRIECLKTSQNPYGYILFAHLTLTILLDTTSKDRSNSVIGLAVQVNRETCYVESEILWTLR